MCEIRREIDENMRELYSINTHIKHTQAPTLQMKSKVVYIVSDMSLKGFLMGLVMDLVYMGLRLIHNLYNVSLTKSIAHLLNLMTHSMT